MKYYLPTSSLNLDTILQAECISPASFYSTRNSGYRKLEVIPQLRAIAPIVLFGYPVKFEILDQDRINYPMLLEIDDDDQLSPNISSAGNGVFTYPTTIYLTPLNCRVYFFSPQHLKNTIVTTRGERGIKYFQEYDIKPVVATLPTREMPSLPDVNQMIWSSKENEVDKVKGCLYGILLGQSLTTTAPIAKQKRVGQDIYDIIAGLLAQTDYSPSLISKLSNAIAEYKSIDIIQLEAEQQIEQWILKKAGEAAVKRKRYVARIVTKLLKEIGLWDFVCKSLADRHNFDWISYPTVSSSLTHGELIKIRDCIEKRTDVATKTSVCDTPSLKLVEVASESVKLPQAPIVSSAIRCIISQQITPDILKAKPLDVLRLIINPFKESYIAKKGEQQWNGSIEREYTNSLARHLKKPLQTFNLTQCPDIELQSIAAFILHGYNLDSLKKYLIINEMYNTVYPMSLWGALRGYQEMSREQISMVLSLENNAYILENTTGIKTDMNAKSRWLKEEALLAIATSDNKTKEEINKIIDIERKQGDPQAFIFILNNLIPKSNTLMKLLADNLLLNGTQGISLREIVEKTILPYKTNKRYKATIEKIERALVLEDKVGDSYAFCCMLDDFDISSKNRRLLYDHFNIPPELRKGTERKNVAKQQIAHTPNLQSSLEFSDAVANESATKFFTDVNVVNELIPEIPTNFVDLFVEDLQWFQNEYAKGSASKNYGHITERDLLSVLDHLTKHLSRKGYLSPQTIKIIMDRLFEKYK